MVSEGELRRARAAGIPAAGSSSPASARRMRNSPSPSPKASPRSTSRAPRSWRCSPRSPARSAEPPVSHSASIPTWTPGPTPKSPPASADNKFGIPYDDGADLYAHAATLPGIVPVGIALPYRQPDAQPRALPRRLRPRRRAGAGSARPGLTVERVDCGGGLGIGYRDEPGTPLPPSLARSRAAFARDGPANSSSSRAAGWSARPACCWHRWF